MNHLRIARKRLGLTQAQVADAIGKSQADVSKYENGTKPADLEVVTRIATTLGMSREQVLWGDESARMNAAHVNVEAMK